MGYDRKLSRALLASIAVPVCAGGTACAPAAWEQDRLKIVMIARCWTVFRIQIGIVKAGNERFLSESLLITVTSDSMSLDFFLLKSNGHL